MNAVVLSSGEDGSIIIERQKLRRPRDSMKSRVYAAELLGGRRMPTVPEMQSYVDQLVRSAWFQRHFPYINRIKVRPGNGHRRATAYFRTIQMPKWARIESVVLHEVAHIATSTRYGDSEVAAHGREFCHTYLRLIQNRIGKDFADLQKRAYREAGIKYSLPRKITPEQREVLRERGRELAAARRKT